MANQANDPIRQAFIPDRERQVRMLYKLWIGWPLPSGMSPTQLKNPDGTPYDGRQRLTARQVMEQVKAMQPAADTTV